MARKPHTFTKLQYGDDDGRDICTGDHPDFDTVEQIDGDQRRWSSTIRVIVKNRFTGMFYSTEWERGNTEYQDHDFIGSGTLTQVVPVDTVTTVRTWEAL